MKWTEIVGKGHFWMETSKEAKDAIGKVPVLSGKRCRQGERMDVILDRIGMGKIREKKKKVNLLIYVNAYSDGIV